MKVTELFKKGTEPTDVSDRYAKLDDVTNLSSKVNGNEVTLSWTGIKTPNAIDEESLKSFFSKFWKNTSIPLKSRKEYNNKYIGNIVYKIYAVLSDGQLQLVNSTSDNSITFSINTSSSDTYIVKTSYSIFTSNMSDGVKVSIDKAGVTDKTEATLIGDNPYVVTSTFSEPGVKVIQNDVDITNSCTITTSYKNSANVDVQVSSINTTGTYTATYNIVCGTFSDTLTRKIVIP